MGVSEPHGKLSYKEGSNLQRGSRERTNAWKGIAGVSRGQTLWGKNFYFILFFSKEVLKKLWSAIGDASIVLILTSLPVEGMRGRSFGMTGGARAVARQRSEVESMPS